MSLFPHRKTRCLLALPLLAWALAAAAQPRLTAEEAVARALDRPHVRLESDARVALAHGDVLDARTWPNPELALESERGTGDAESRESSVVLSQTFDIGGRRGLQRDAAALGVVAARHGVAFERARLRADVLRDYAAAAGGEQRRDVHARAAAGLTELADAAGRRAREGDLSGYESRRIAQAREQASARAAVAEAEARAARARLAARVGDIALTATLDPAPPLPPVPALPDTVRSAELDVLQARFEHAQATARAARRPALPVTVGVGSKRIDEGGHRADAVILEIDVPLPLFDRGQAERTRAAAEADLAAAELERARAATASRRAAALAEAQALSGSARHLLEDAVPEAARLTAIARASYADGELDLVGLLDAYAAEAEVIDQALDQHARALDALLELQSFLPLTDHPHP